MACSADGLTAVAAVTNGRLFVTTNGGTSWTGRESSRTWRAVASSSDGVNLVAVAFNDYIFTSSDSGQTWQQRDTTTRQWAGVTSSSDGQKLVAVVGGNTIGKIWRSTDAGLNWNSMETDRNYLSVASSADGTHIIATTQNDYMYRTIFSGASGTWSTAGTLGTRSFAAMSADGLRVIVGGDSQQLQTSIDRGNAWTLRETARTWTAAASSNDGTLLIASVQNGRIYRSTDSGATWVVVY